MVTRDALAEYEAKRDFTRTAEPRGKTGKRGGHMFVVQKHDARRLHYDFRLEMDGVLKSWAVTRGPSLDPADKRLAVRTEDHPLSYHDFEGTIPQGEYGGGTVMLWDKGSWKPVPGKSEKDLEKGHLHFILDGERMKGEWLLVRMKPRKGEKRENWLLRKIDDAYAGGSDDLVGQKLTSVLTNRSMTEIAGDKKGSQSLRGKRGESFAKAMQSAARHHAGAARRSGKARKTLKLPAFRAPQLATLVDSVPTGNDWFHEIKFDGYRCLMAVAGEKARAYTRSGQDWSDKFAPLCEALAALDLPPCLIDGEITAPGSDGNPSFSALQQMLKRGHGAQGKGQWLDFHAFDLLEIDGEDLSGRGNLERKEMLAALLADARPPLFVADHVVGAGEKLYTSLCGAGQEGIISKRADAPYRSRHTRNWLKVKCTRRQEFVLAGWTPSKAKGRPFASLLLAQYEGDKLVYKGKVGTGFGAETMARIAEKLDARARRTPPLEISGPEARGVRWVRADLLAEIAFGEFTADGRVRHGSFLGLRTDKKAADVTPEQPEPVPPSAAAGVRITSRDRVIFPDAGRTKGDLADYVAAIAPIMLPHMARRPLSLVRCPQGRAKKCFFQKHDSGSFGEHVRHVPIREKSGAREDYLYVEDAAGILACVQMGTIEFHGWACHVEDVERPDRMIFDLDPDEGLDFGDVKKAAFDLRRHLSDIGLVSFAMLSGGKGVHVIVPLTPGHDWDAHKDFASRFAGALAMAEPDRFTATMSKAKRKGRIFIDWLRNQRGSTAIAPYSARARTGASVAAPVSWEELRDVETPAAFSISDAEKLLQRASGKALRGWGFAEQPLPDL